MRGYLIQRNIKVFLVGVAVLFAVGFFRHLANLDWVKIIAEKKVSDFTGGHLDVKIGHIQGGIITDMVLEDVSILPAEGKGKESFGLKRMVISYRLWDVIKDRVFKSQKESLLRSIEVYFSSENPFLRGFVKFKRTDTDNIFITGSVAPEVFGQSQEKPLKGGFRVLETGEYECNFLWDNSTNIIGKINPEGRNLQLDFMPQGETKKGIIKLTGNMDPDGIVKGYLRLDKVDVFGSEVIADVSISFQDRGSTFFLVKAENILIDKQPFWGLVIGGGYSPKEKMLCFDNVKWGSYITLFGKVSTQKPFDSKITLLLKELPMQELSRMTGGDVTTKGIAEGEINFGGDLDKMAVSGRLFIRDGVLDTMEYKSLFATLKGTWPVIEIADSRVVKEGGNILVSGFMDFSKMQEGTTFDTLVFETDNKVAVWEDWQITKEDSFNVVEARKDNLIFSTSLEKDEFLNDISGPETQKEKDISCRYKLDGENNLKIDFDEGDDFFGLEHRVEF